MLLHLIFYIIELITVGAQNVDVMSNVLGGKVSPIQYLKADDAMLMDNEIQALQEGPVKIQVYYESLCGPSRAFITQDLTPTVAKLAKYLDLQIYPYGNAKTTDKGNGQYEIKCQHGPKECYGNKLHDCAIVILNNMTQAVLFNSCMMEPEQKDSGSDDDAADACGKQMSIDPEPIKNCAKGPFGAMFLKYYGDESKKIGFKYVPFILINEKEYMGTEFMKDVCAIFTVPPPECKQ